MSGRIFREIHEKYKDAPTSRGVMWLRPGGGSYWLMVYKPETGEWIELNKTTWADILDKPFMFETVDAFNSYVDTFVSKWLNGNGMADDIAFRYDGSVPQITSLAKTLARGDEALPSVDAALERIIAKVWFRPLEATLAGMSGNVYIGEVTKAYTLAYSVTNLVAGEGAGASISASDAIMSLTTSGAVGEGSGTVSVASFTPAARKDYAVTLTATCEDSDGNAGGQTVTRRCSVSAYWPCWAWRAAEPQGCESKDGRMMVTGDVKFSYEPGRHYYHLLVPNEVSTATQANTGDWNGNLKKVDCDYSLAGRRYILYRSPSAISSTADKAATVTVKLTTIN